jgi:hypothetical protein
MSRNNVEGVVVKVTDEKIVILSNNGTFKNLPRGKGDFPLLGERISYQEERKIKLPFQWAKYGTAVAILLAIIGTFLYDGNQEQSSQAYYTVAIDINPSIEVVTNQQLEVTEVHALNPDGEKVISSLVFEHKTVTQVIQEILVKSKDLGYLKDNGKVTASLISLTQENELSTKSMDQLIKGVLDKQGVKAKVEIYEDKKQNLVDAHKMNMSINSYRLFLDEKKKHKGLNERLNTKEVLEERNPATNNQTSGQGVDKEEETKVNENSDKKSRQGVQKSQERKGSAYPIGKDHSEKEPKGKKKNQQTDSQNKDEKTEITGEAPTKRENKMGEDETKQEQNNGSVTETQKDSAETLDGVENIGEDVELDSDNAENHETNQIAPYSGTDTTEDSVPLEAGQTKSSTDTSKNNSSQ